MVDLSLVTRKPVFGVSDQVRLTPACSATETRQTLGILDIETRGIKLSKQRTIKALISLHGCAADLRLCCSHMAKTGFRMTWLILYGIVVTGHSVCSRFGLRCVCILSNISKHLFTIKTLHITVNM